MIMCNLVLRVIAYSSLLGNDIVANMRGSRDRDSNPGPRLSSKHFNPEMGVCEQNTLAAPY